MDKDQGFDKDRFLRPPRSPCRSVRTRQAGVIKQTSKKASRASKQTSKERQAAARALLVLGRVLDNM